MYAYKNDPEQLEGRQDPDDFLHQFITSDDEMMKRIACCCDFGSQPLANEKHDVPLQDMYNRGLTLTQETWPRVNLALEGNRPGVTGFIPSMEEAYRYPGTLPMGQKLLTNLNA